jgi:hypothetical protein
MVTISLFVMESYGQIKWEWHKTNLKAQTGWYKTYQILFTNDRFFALGTGNYIASSTDGISWDSIFVGPITTRKKSITYGPSGYVLAEEDTNGDSTFIWSSEKGNAWVKRYSIHGYSFKVAYGNGQYVIAGFAGSTSGNAWTLTSSDATTWARHNPDSTIFCFTDITYANQKFVAVGATMVPGWAGFTMTSSDGSTWTNKTPEAERLPYELWSVAFGNNRFVALGQNGGSFISSDGISWSRGDTSLTDDFMSITYGKGYFVGIGQGRIFQSTDGVHWTTTDTVSTCNAQYQIAYGNDRFVMSGKSDSVLISKPFEPVHCADFTDVSQSLLKIQIVNNVLSLTVPLKKIGNSSQLTCHDATGRNVFDIPLSPSNAMITYNTKHLSPGLYVLSMIGKGGSINRSFVINR